MNVPAINLANGVLRGSPLVSTASTAFGAITGDTVYTIVLQLVAVPVGNDGKLDNSNAIEIAVTPFVVSPSTIQFQYGHRMAIMQTEENVYVDQYGRNLTRVMMQGTFGVKPRPLAGLMTGYERLLDFKKKIMKWGYEGALMKDQGLATIIAFAENNGLHSIVGVTMPQLTVVGTNAPLNLRLTPKNRYVFVVNFYSFYDQEFFSSILDSVRITETVQMNNLPVYAVNVLEVGGLVGLESNNPLLQSLNDSFKFYQANIEAPLLEAQDVFSSSPLYKQAVSQYVHADVIGGLTKNDLRTSLGF